MGGPGAGHGRRRRLPVGAGLGPGQQGHRPGRHARPPRPGHHAARAGDRRGRGRRLRLRAPPGPVQPAGAADRGLAAGAQPPGPAGDGGGRRADRPRVGGSRLGPAAQRDRRGRGRPGGGPGRPRRRPPLRPGPGRGLGRSLLGRRGRGRPAAGVGPARPGGGAPGAEPRPGPGRGRPAGRRLAVGRPPAAGGRRGRPGGGPGRPGRLPGGPPWRGWSSQPGAHTFDGLAAVEDGDPGDDDPPSPRRTGRRHLEAAILEAEGDPAAALDAYLRVLEDRDLYRAAYLVADCHQGAARCLLALGDRRRALDHARQAAQLLDRWPGWRRDEAAALLRRLGHGSTRPDDPTPSPPANARSPPSSPKASPTARSPVASTSPPRPPRSTSPTSSPSSA